MRDNTSRVSVNMCGFNLGYMRYSLLKSDTIHFEVMMDVVSRFQATIIYSSAPEMIQPSCDIR
jgi:hypothetical protein